MKIALVLVICIVSVVTPLEEEKTCADVDELYKCPGKKSEKSTISYNYPKCLEHLVNDQIGMELRAFHTYLNMSHYFEREDNDLPGARKFFHDHSQEELEHAQKFMRYQNKRGGSIAYKVDFPVPTEIDQGTGGEKKEEKNCSTLCQALESALVLEKLVTHHILCLHWHAQKLNDVDLQNFLETHFVPEQYDSIKLLSNYIKTLKRMTEGGNGFAEYQFDMITLKGDKN